MAYAPTPCAVQGCPQYAKTNGTCPEHTIAWAGSTRSQRLPKDWNTRRLIVMKRDNNLCYLCGNVGVDVDHIQPGDNHELTNLAPICSPCHKTKTNKEANEAKNGNKIKRRY